MHTDFTWGLPTLEDGSHSAPSSSSHTTQQAALQVSQSIISHYNIYRSRQCFLANCMHLPPAAIMVLLQKDHYAFLNGLGEAVLHQPPQSP